MESWLLPNSKQLRDSMLCSCNVFDFMCIDYPGLNKVFVRRLLPKENRKESWFIQILPSGVKNCRKLIHLQQKKTHIWEAANFPVQATHPHWMEGPWCTNWLGPSCGAAPAWIPSHEIPRVNSSWCRKSIKESNQKQHQTLDRFASIIEKYWQDAVSLMATMNSEPQASKVYKNRPIRLKKRHVVFQKSDS